MSVFVATDHLELRDRVIELERRLRQVEWKADSVFDAERQRREKDLAFWWDVYRLAAVLSVLVPLGIVLLRR